MPTQSQQIPIIEAGRLAAETDAANRGVTRHRHLREVLTRLAAKISHPPPLAWRVITPVNVRLDDDTMAILNALANRTGIPSRRLAGHVIAAASGASVLLEVLQLAAEIGRELRGGEPPLKARRPAKRRRIVKRA